MADAITSDSAEKKSPLKLILLIVVGLVLVAGSVGATVFLLSKDGDEAASKGAQTAKKGEVVHEGPAIYHPFENFVVNFDGKSKARFLQIKAQAMSHDPEAIEALKNNIPMIRNSLVMLFSQQTDSDLRTREGKEKLRKQALKEVQKVLKKEYGEKGVEEIFFTSLVMQ